VALYRFLFAPVLLAVAVLTTSPRRAPHPPPAPPELTAVASPALVPAHARDHGPVREPSRVGPSHPGSVPAR
jgi:hypothetical protein